MIHSELPISTVCSLQFAAVNRHKLRNVVSIHRVVWAIKFVTLYWGLDVINLNNISSLRFLIYRVIKFIGAPDDYNTQIYK
jgi:hypothetical protein